MDEINAVVWRTVLTDASLEVSDQAGVARVIYRGPLAGQYYPSAKREEWAHYLPQDLGEAILAETRDAAAAKKDLRTVLTGFDRGVFIRSTKNDHKAAWGILLLPYLSALGRLAKFAGHLAQETAPGKEGE